MSFIEKLLKDHPHVHIQDDKRDSVEEKIRSLINDGRKQLHVVADFDFTLTNYERDLVILPTTFGVIKSSKRITLVDGSSLNDQVNQLHPIESDGHVNSDEKLAVVIEWWTKAKSFLLSSNMNQLLLRDIVYESKMELRKGVQKFIMELIHSEIPFLIFSAGLGDVIELFLQKEIPEFKNNHHPSHIISDFMEYNTDGKLISFNNKMIHSLNKNEQEILDLPYYQSIINRSNVILLGDAIDDIGMIDTMKNLKQVLTLGFLNRNTPEKIEAYKNIYDIVICDDQTFDIPNMILNAI